MAYGAWAVRKAAAFDFQPIVHMPEYLQQLEAEGRNPDYIRTVRNGLHHFAEFLRSENVVSPEEITRMHIVRFQATCKGREATGEWKKSYSIQILKKARAWINWLVRVEYISSNPWVGVRVGTVKKQPHPLTPDEMQALYAAHMRTAFSVDPFIFHRREVILTLLYGWALRINELVALTETQMDMRADFVGARNKSATGNDRKTQPYTPEIKQRVARYLTHRARYAKPGCDALLITTTGKPFTIEMVRNAIYGLGTLAGVNVNPHRLRDTVGTDLVNKDDVKVESVQLLFGHTDRDMTLAYASINDETVYAMVEGNVDPRLRDLFRNTRELRSAG